ncbi:hypothetical protein AOQ84DRAFT_375393 [Glonium stellatum]|uniref:Rhodopsin domain-containing protein n=1 Tax=Glonium stellatum TaxID=574774 RepID=A0A8E2F419_9PEZI|nr:hypothetical protein AOQ84DRAFT_375393 [Glonium stellatum]
MAAGIVLPCISTIVVALRFYTRSSLKSEKFLDDWLTVPALVFTTGMGIAMVIRVACKGLGYPTPQPLNRNDALNFMTPTTVITRKVEYSVELMQFPALTCVKLSFLVFYQRIFSTPWRRAVKAFFFIMIFLCILWGLGFFFSMTFICGTHFSAYWTTVHDLKAYCPHLLTQQAWLVCTDFVIDAIIFLIPIPLIVRLNLTIGRKIAVLAIFLFAAVAVAASITRMVVFLRAIENLERKYKTTGYDNRKLIT